ncbi:MAG: hypothetical protein LAO06_14665 [Acidobacteriia bacterium]|nr:hypothetical protein [Terriglobia bacterium]
MIRIFCRSLFCLVILASAMGCLQGAAQAQLPPALAALAPPGTQVSSPTFSKAPTFADAAFVADKKLPGNHSVHYSFHLLCQDTNSALWKMRAPIYQAETNKKIDAKRESFKAGSNPPISYDPAKETKYPWGTGFTQRVVHHYMGAGTGPDYVDYRTAYFGMIGGVMFELTVDGATSAGEADQWAKNVAEKAAGMSIANIGN